MIKKDGGGKAEIQSRIMQMRRIAGAPRTGEQKKFICKVCKKLAQMSTCL